MGQEFYDIRLRDLRFFSRVAALRSITSAAKELGVPKPTASRWLAQLEDRAGVPLVKRTTRSVALTAAGEELARRAEQLLSLASQTQLAVQADQPGGVLRVSVPVPMGRILAGPVIVQFRRQMPNVRLEIALQNERVDLIRDGIDLAVRGGPLTDSDLLARRLSTAGMWLYAAPRFADHALDQIPFIAAPGDRALLRRSELALDIEPAVVVEDRTAVADALVWGAGMALLPSFLGEPSRAEGALVRLRETSVASMPIHALYHASARQDPRLQALVEVIARQLDSLL